MLAVNFEREACVKLLLARGGRALNLDLIGHDGTALHHMSSLPIVRLLLEAGADPTIRNGRGELAIVSTAREYLADWKKTEQDAVFLPAMTEPQRPRALLKARRFVDASLAVPKAYENARSKGL